MLTRDISGSTLAPRLIWFRRPVAIVLTVLLWSSGLSACAAQSAHSPASKPVRTTDANQAWVKAAGSMNGVTVGPGGQAWAVGDALGASGFDEALIVRWNGKAWSRTPSPSPGGSANLFQVAAGPDGTAWAVGYSCEPECSANATAEQPLILRWNGTEWSQTSSPSPGSNASLTGVALGADGTALAVGGVCTSSCGTASAVTQTLILRWDGSAWSRVQAPSPGGSAILASVISAPDGSAWAVGHACASRCTGLPSGTLILHWNGANWSQTPSSGSDAFLLGVTAASDGGAPPHDRHLVRSRQPRLLRRPSLTRRHPQDWLKPDS